MSQKEREKTGQNRRKRTSQSPAATASPDTERFSNVRRSLPLDFAEKVAYNESAKDRNELKQSAHEQTESPIGIRSTDGASCLLGISVCRA